jgi:microcystin-dependent protein
MPVTINGTTGIVTPNITGNGSVPTGSVYHFASSTAPTGFLICNGDAVPNGSGTVQGVTTDFSALYAILGTTYGVAGTLPDLRGYFVRGAGTNSDGTAAGTFGVKQNDELRSHRHTTPTGAYSQYNETGGGGAVGSLFNGASNTGFFGGTETRPKNIALLPCIKY